MSIVFKINFIKCVYLSHNNAHNHNKSKVLIKID